MKQLTCEMCGSTELVKDGGFFICQTCGCKYSVEEAEKMMIEGTVEVTGTVKVDDTSRFDSYYKLAQTAIDGGNLNEAENYCNKCLEINPNSPHAWITKGKAIGWQGSIESDIRISEAIPCFKQAIENAAEEEKEEIQNITGNEVLKIFNAVIGLYCRIVSETPELKNCEKLIDNYYAVDNCAIKFLTEDCNFDLTDFAFETIEQLNNTAYTAWKEKIVPVFHKKGPYPSKRDWENFANRSMGCKYILDLAIELATAINYKKEKWIEIYKNMIEIYEAICNSRGYSYNQGCYVTDGELSEKGKEQLQESISIWREEIRKLNPSGNSTDNEMPQVKTAQPQVKATQPQGKKGGCYVATCVYGSYDCPEVWTLRRYRDETLGATRRGRAFIRTYYAISPTLVKWFGKTKWFKKMWRGKLDRIVAKLQSKGVENTPYEDKNW